MRTFPKEGRPGGILVVDDDASLADALRNFLTHEGYRVEIALSGQEALSVQAKVPGICLALVDLIMPLTDGLALMEELRKGNPDLAVVIMTGFGTIETAVEAIKRGAEDYLTKPFDQEAIRKKIGRLMEVFELRGRVAELESNLNRCAPSFESLVHISPPMQQVVEQARTAAEEEVAFAESLCEPPLDTLVAVHRGVDEGDVRETFRTLRPRAGAKPARAFSFFDVEGEEEPGERIDLAGMAGREQR